MKKKSLSKTDCIEKKKDEQSENSFFVFLRRFFTRFDWLQIVSMLLLLSIGCAFIYGAGHQVGGNFEIYWKRQVLYACIGIMLWLLLVFFDYRWLGPLSVFLYPVAVVSLVYVLIWGVTLSGSTQWVRIGDFTIQPSEMAKPVMIITVSWLLSLKKANINNFFWLLLTLLLTGVPVALI